MLNGFRARRGTTVCCHDYFTRSTQQPTVPIKHLESLNVCIKEISGASYSLGLCFFSPDILLYLALFWRFIKKFKNKCIDGSQFFGILQNVDVLFTVERLQKDPPIPNYMLSSIASCTVGHCTYRPSGASADLPLVCLNEKPGIPWPK